MGVSWGGSPNLIRTVADKPMGFYAITKNTLFRVGPCTWTGQRGAFGGIVAGRRKS